MRVLVLVATSEAITARAIEHIVPSVVFADDADRRTVATTNVGGSGFDARERGVLLGHALDVVDPFQLELDKGHRTNADDRVLQTIGVVETIPSRVRAGLHLARSLRVGLE